MDGCVQKSRGSIHGGTVRHSDIDFDIDFGSVATSAMYTTVPIVEICPSSPYHTPYPYYVYRTFRRTLFVMLPMSPDDADSWAWRLESLTPSTTRPLFVSSTNNPPTTAAPPTPTTPRALALAAVQRVRAAFSGVHCNLSACS